MFNHFRTDLKKLKNEQIWVECELFNDFFIFLLALFAETEVK